MKIANSTKVLLIVSSSIVAISISGYGLWRYQSNSQISSSSEASILTETINQVAAIGYLEPEGEVVQLSAPSFQQTRRVEQLFVTEGDDVQKGTVIAILDNHQRLLANVKQAEAQLQLAKSNLEKVRQGEKKGDIDAQRFRFQSLQAELQGQILSQKASINNLQAQLAGEALAQQAKIDRIEAELKNATVKRNEV